MYRTGICLTRARSHNSTETDAFRYLAAWMAFSGRCVAGGEEFCQVLYAGPHRLLHLGSAAGPEQGHQLRPWLSSLARHHLVQPCDNNVLKQLCRFIFTTGIYCIMIKKVSEPIAMKISVDRQ